MSTVERVLPKVIGVLTELGAEALLRHEALVEHLARQGHLDPARFRAFRDGYVLEHWKDVTHRVAALVKAEFPGLPDILNR